MSSEKSDDLEVRLGHLNLEMLESLYRNICRSLFAKDKLVFSTMLALKLMELKDELDAAELKIFLTGGVSLGEELPKCPVDWINEKQWGEMNRLDKLPKFKGFVAHF
jgi:dynein heavy chain